MGQHGFDAQAVPVARRPLVGKHIAPDITFLETLEYPVGRLSNVSSSVGMDSSLAAALTFFTSLPVNVLLLLPRAPLAKHRVSAVSSTFRWSPAGIFMKPLDGAP